MVSVTEKLKWIVFINMKGKDYLKFNFPEFLTKTKAEEMCAELKSISTQGSTQKYSIIFEALKMKDYDPIARITFQKTLKELKDQIEKTWLVTDSKLISTGASVISVFTSLSIKSVHSEEEIFSWTKS